MERVRLLLRKDAVASAMDKYKNSWKRQIGRVEKFVDNIKSKGNSIIGQASTFINEVSGYEHCEKLRRQVTDADLRFGRLKEGLKQSRRELDRAVRERSLCQKELNSLLQSKQSWKEEDLSRFTELYRNEIRFEQAESNARMTNESWENQVDEAHQVLMNALRERYQEEQLWSDKIRRVSTYGTFSLMGLNLILFLLIQLYIEPRKRARMMHEFDILMQNSHKSLMAEMTALPIYLQTTTTKPSEVPSGSDIGGYRQQLTDYFGKHTAAIYLGLSALIATTLLRSLS